MFDLLFIRKEKIKQERIDMADGWKVNAKPDFVTDINPQSGTESKTVTFKINPVEAGSAKTGVIEFFEYEGENIKSTRNVNVTTCRKAPDCDCEMTVSVDDNEPFPSNSVGIEKHISVSFSECVTSLTVDCSDSFVHLEDSRPSPDFAYLTITVDTNSSGDRSAVINLEAEGKNCFDSKSITISQEGRKADCSEFGVSPSDISFTYDGQSVGTSTITVDDGGSGTEWSFTAVTDDGEDWLNCEKSENSISVNVEPNTGNQARKGSVTITFYGGCSKTVNISQASLNCDCSNIEIDGGEEAILPSKGGSITKVVKLNCAHAEEQTLHFTPRDVNDFIVVSPTQASGNREQGVTITISPAEGHTEELDGYIDITYNDDPACGKSIHVIKQSKTYCIKPSIPSGELSCADDANRTVTFTPFGDDECGEN